MLSFFETGTMNDVASERVIVMNPNVVRFAVSCAIIAASALSASAQADDKSKLGVDGFTQEVAPFLSQYCIRCHGETKPKADLSLHQLTGDLTKKADIETWKSVLDQLEIREMPPEDAKQPKLNERAKLVLQIKAMLKRAGETINDGKWRTPSKGNWVDHDTLFSTKTTTENGTQARLWRVTGQAYEEFMSQKNLQYKLGIRDYGPQKIRSPWNFMPQRDFNDYASSHRIGEAEVEYHMRNATTLAQAMVKRFANNRPSPGYADWIKEINDVLKAGDAATPEQARAVTPAAFKSILGREPSAKELERYTGFLEKNLKPLGAEKAVEHFLIALLFQPELTYRIEIPADGASRQILSPYALSRALAFTLTDRNPDANLAKAVSEGKLATREDVRLQVVRILGDAKLEKPRILRFFQEYFGHHAAEAVFKDEVTLKASGIGEKNAWHPNYFISDADRLIEWVLASDKNVLQELLTTSKTFTLTMDPKSRDKQGEGTRNNRNTNKPFQKPEQTVLDIYEVSMKSRLDWTDERPFEMPAAHRMGMLTHPSWLIAQSGNFDNHAIHRGRWIREKLLGGRIPDVPITVNAMLPDEPHKTLRDRMRVTREEYCWKCHQQMDPLGMPFEQFDHFGRYRTAEQIMDKTATADPKNQNKDGSPRQTKYTSAKLDTTGAVERTGIPKLDGPVQDPFELIRKLAASEHVQQVFVRHVFRYFLGRNETLEDGPTLVAAHRAYVDNGGSMNALIASLLTSDAFLYRNSDAKTKR